METKIYYGEYSLFHWIELIVTKNIILPPYQRSFVWTEEQVKQLILSFAENNFIPPITIGAFKENNKVVNYILDGQQRLTSIILASIGFFPDKEKFYEIKNSVANENDDNEIDSSNSDKPIEWTFAELLKSESIEEIKNLITVDKKYKRIDDYQIVNFEFLRTHYLGFSYIVPQTKEKKEQQKLFSTTFRNINAQGRKLSVLESRKSLYFLSEGLDELFEPDCVSDIRVNDGKLDFTRYLAFLSNAKYKGIESVGYRYGRYLEDFYEEFVYYVSNEETTEKSIFGDLSKLKSNFLKYKQKLNDAIKIVGIKRKFDSIIDCDIYFFGLINLIYFEEKDISSTADIIKLKQELDKIIKNIRGDKENNFRHLKRPSSLKYIKERINKSIEVYEKYASE